MSKKQKILLSLIAVLISLFLLLKACGDSSAEKEQAHRADNTSSSKVTRSCEAWKNRYPTLTLKEKGNFDLPKGTWVLELQGDRWLPSDSTWFESSNHFWIINEIRKYPKIETPEIQVAGSGYADLDSYSDFRFRGKGCILITTDKEGFRQLMKNTKPRSL